MKQSDIITRKYYHQFFPIVILLAISALCATQTSAELFTPGKEYVYSYDATSSVGVLLPATASTGWGIRGKLVIQAQNDSVFMQLRSLKTSAWNGARNESNEEWVDLSDEAIELLNPFRVTYNLGLVQNISVKTEPSWATNIKQSIAGILQLDVVNVRQELASAFYSLEKNHYGQCNIEYVVTPASDEEKLVRKSVDPRTCRGHPARLWSNVPRMICPNNDQNPVLKSSERLYKVKSSDNLDTILFVNATGGIYVQPFQSLGEAQFLFARQVFQLQTVDDITDAISTTHMNTFEIQHDLPENDVSMLRSVPSKSHVFKSIGDLLDKLSHRLENPGLDVEVENLHNTTISDLLYYTGMLEREDLQKVYNEISGTSYKEETVRNLFLEALPQVGSKEAALFVLDLIQQKKVSDITAVQLLTHLPFHVRKPDVKLLVDLQALLNLPDNAASEVQNTAILTFGTLIYKTCLIYCPYEMLDDYVRLYLDKFTDSKQYEKKMVWLEGLANIQLGKVVEFLEPIARGDSTGSRHLRFLAAWASLPTAPLRPDVIHPVYWPILANRSEHLELRVAALTLLIVSSPSPSRLISLYWYMQGEPDQHLYNFFYTTLKSVERTNFPCYTHIGQIAAQFTRVLRQPLTKKRLVTGNYLIDYQDTYRHFGAMIQAVIIGNPVSNIPTVSYVTLNNHGAGINFNQVSLYIKADGALAKIAPHKESGDILEVLKQFRIKAQPEKPVHVEVIAQIQGKAVLCLHLNETNIKKGYKFLMDLTEYAYIFQNMAFHINQQRINVPLTMDSVQVTDLGTNARVSAMATSLFSMRGDFTYIPLGRNNRVILRTSIHGVEAIETYNPLTDLWHGAQRAQSIHGYLPINITVGLDRNLFFSYITPAEHVTTGITAHVRTTTNIRGPKLKDKLKLLCAKCAPIHTARKHPENEPKEYTILQLKTPELGGQLNVKVFNCDSHVSQDRLIADIMASHRSNYQIWPALKSGMLGFHFMDYFTYVPPGGSCGLGAHVELYSVQPTEVKVEFVKNNTQNMISLTRRPVGTETVLQEWNIGIIYQAVGWAKDMLKITGTRFERGENPWQIRVEAERIYPWESSVLSNTPSASSSMKLNVDWGTSDTAKGNSSIQLSLRGEISDDQIQESESRVWPYEECREQSSGKNFVPYTEACYQTSRELSTLRKYQATIAYDNLPKFLLKSAWKLRALYDLIGGNSSVTDRSKSDQLIISAVFPKGSSRAEMRVNGDNVSLKLNPSIIDYFLTRTRMHKYWDSFIVENFFSSCLVSPTIVRSIYNVSLPISQNEETLLLRHCHGNEPGFAITTKSDSSSLLTFTLYEGGDKMNIVPGGSGGSVYSNDVNLKLERNYEFRDIKGKKIRAGDNTIELLYSDIALFMYWTPEQVVLLFPNYVLEFTCGLCANLNNEET